MDLTIRRTGEKLEIWNCHYATIAFALFWFIFENFRESFTPHGAAFHFRQAIENEGWELTGGYSLNWQKFLETAEDKIELINLMQLSKQYARKQGGLLSMEFIQSLMLRPNYSLGILPGKHPTIELLNMIDLMIEFIEK